MTETAPGNLHAILPDVRRFTLTKEQVFRLWRCAIKDDDLLVDAVIHQVYEEMTAFNGTRAKCVMELIVDRDLTAAGAFRSLLNDMRAVNDAGFAGRCLAGTAGFLEHDPEKTRPRI